MRIEYEYHIGIKGIIIIFTWKFLMFLASLDVMWLILKYAAGTWKKNMNKIKREKRKYHCIFKNAYLLY